MDLLTYAALKKKLSGGGGGSETSSDLQTIVNLDGTDVTQMAADNTEYRAGTLTSLRITLPSDVSDTYESSIVFTSGATPTNGIFPDNIKWTGTGVVENNGAVALVPIENTRYNISLWYDGKFINAVVRGVDDEPTA